MLAFSDDFGRRRNFLRIGGFGLGGMVLPWQRRPGGVDHQHRLVLFQQFVRMRQARVVADVVDRREDLPQRPQDRDDVPRLRSQVLESFVVVADQPEPGFDARIWVAGESGEVADQFHVGVDGGVDTVNSADRAVRPQQDLCVLDRQPGRVGCAQDLASTVRLTPRGLRRLG